MRWADVLGGLVEWKLMLRYKKGFEPCSAGLLEVSSLFQYLPHSIRARRHHFSTRNKYDAY